MRVKIIKNYNKVYVFGDIHGDYKTLKKIESLINDEDLFIFLGDYADRGEESYKTVKRIMELWEEYENVITLKGNHEDYDEYGNPNFYPCDLIYDVERNNLSWKDFFENEFKKFINSIPIAVILKDFALLVHGGVSKKIERIEDFEKFEDIVLWSDPFEGHGEYPNPRGKGILFGKDTTEIILKRFNLKYIIRSHEPQKANLKPFFEHDGRVITIQTTKAYEKFGIPMKPHYLIISNGKISWEYL